MTVDNRPANHRGPSAHDLAARRAQGCPAPADERVSVSDNVEAASGRAHRFPRNVSGNGLEANIVEPMGSVDLNVATRSRAPAKRSGTILIGVASDDFRTISGHAGRCCRFLVFDAHEGKPPRERERLEFRRELSIRGFSGAGPHPLDIVQALIVGDAGPASIGWMSARGIEVVRTAESDPVAAVATYLKGKRRLASVAGFARPEDGAEGAELLKAMANETRLRILCLLRRKGERSVSELERELELHQARVSQQLARLRRAGLVKSRTVGPNVFYNLASARVSAIIALLYEIYCAQHAK